MMDIAENIVRIFVTGCFTFTRIMYAIIPKKTVAIVAWPLGKAKPVSCIREKVGLGLWIISFKIRISPPETSVAVAKRIPCFFDFLE